MVTRGHPEPQVRSRTSPNGTDSRADSAGSVLVTRSRHLVVSCHAAGRESSATSPRTRRGKRQRRRLVTQAEARTGRPARADQDQSQLVWPFQGRRGLGHRHIVEVGIDQLRSHVIPVRVEGLGVTQHLGEESPRTLQQLPVFQPAAELQARARTERAIRAADPEPLRPESWA